MLVNFEGSDISLDIDDDNQVWFLGQDVIRELGMSVSHTSRTIEQYVFLEYRQKRNVGEGRPAWYIAEPGFYQLAFKATTDKARRLQKYVFEVILPNIRKKGLHYETSVFNDEEIARLEAVVVDKDKRLKELTKISDLTDELVSDLKAEFRNRIDTLLNGLKATHGRQRKYRTFSQIVKALYDMGFVYDIARMRLALKYYNELTGSNHPILLTNSPSGYDKIKLMECIYQSMRYDNNLNDSDESMNMILFYEIFGIKAGIPTLPQYKARDTVHDRIEKFNKLKSKVS